MQNNVPNPNTIFPVQNVDYVINVKPTITNKNIIVGDFTYFSDTDFEKHVTHHYDFYGDKLIIGKFCQIAKGVEFVMNGANHRMSCISTFPFYIFEGWEESVPQLDLMHIKGDTLIGSDVWIGQNATILPGVHIGDGAIIGLNSVVTCDVAPYTVVAGNPARAVKKRFDDAMVEFLLKLKWWDKSIEEIKQLIPVLHEGNLVKAKQMLL
jgi:virginiamycin A acetyltransferase